MNDLITWAGARLTESSTWVGIIGAAATIFGIHVSPELAASIGTAGVAVTGAVLVFIRQHGSKA